MKLLLFSILTFLISSCSNKNNSNKNIEINKDDEIYQISDTYQIADWKNFAKAAITHTWDDNTAKQLTVARPLYDAYNFKATFFTTTNWVSNWDNQRSAALNGHEIASHSLDHSNFSNITEVKIKNQLEESKLKIDTEVPSQKCLTIAYPFCSNESYNLTKQNYIAARVCDNKIVSKSPSDFMNISSFACGSETENNTANDFNILAKNTISNNGWTIYLFHGIDNDGGYSPILSSELKTHLQFLNKNKEVYWVDTFLNVIKYIKERDAISVNQKRKTNKKITVEFTDILDNSIYNYPITVKKEIPVSWVNANVSQNNTVLISKMVNENAKRYLIFDVVPDAGVVVITK